MDSRQHSIHSLPLSTRNKL